MPTVPPDFAKLPLFRSYAVEDDETGDLIRVEVRQCPHSGARIEVRTRMTKTTPAQRNQL